MASATEVRLESQIKKLQRRLPLAFRYFEGTKEPPVANHEVVFWRDTSLAPTATAAMKILVRLSEGRTITFSSD